MEFLYQKFIVVVIFLMGCTNAVVAQDNQPNIIVILVDDAGYADWGFQNSPTILSPNIDKLVTEGLNFTQGYVTNSVCAPSRAGLITGQYQNKFGFEYNIVSYSASPGHALSEVGLKPGIPTIANYLNELGYKTGAFGKWHLGENIDNHHPNNRGFDYFFGLLGGSRKYHIPETSKGKKLMRNFDFAEPSGDFYITDVLTDDFMNFMDVAEDEDKPFFAYLSYTAPHGPYYARPEDKLPFQGMGLKGNRLEYHGMIYNLDNNIGRIVTKLKQEGKYDNTLIFFLSDNGGKLPVTDNGVLRKGKGSQYEGGLRVPFIMTWPNKVSGNTSYDQQVISLDIAPTVIEAAGGDMTICRHFDGKSLLPVVNNNKTVTHDILYWRKQDVWEVVSDGTNKVIINNNNWGDDDNDTLAFNLNTNIKENDAGDYYSSSSSTLSQLIDKHKVWKSKLTLPYWIGKFQLNVICPNEKKAKDCEVLVERYNSFEEPEIEDCNSAIGYYLSTSDGADTNDGQSPESPWKSLKKLNETRLMPGDHVYFKSRDTFVGQLIVDESGVKDQPIVFGKYGEGNYPILDGANEEGGAYITTIYIKNQNYIEFNKLEINNDRKISRDGENKKIAYGIYVRNTGVDLMTHFRFNDLIIKGIYPVNTWGQEHNDWQTAGIYIRSEKNKALNNAKNISDVIVQNCYFSNLAKFGFWSQHEGGNPGIGNDSINRNMNFIIRKNHFYKIGGSGITPGRTYNCLVENNLIEYPGSDMDYRMAKRGSGAWFFSCINVVAQHNIVRHARGDNDSYGIHIDMNNKYVIVQNNYSEDNEGGFVEVLGNNNFVTYRYNISVNDGFRQIKGNTLWVSDFHPNKLRSNNVYIYNNSIYVSSRANGEFLTPGLSFKSKNVNIYNNIFFTESQASIGIKEYKVKIANGSVMKLSNNLFQGNIKTIFINRDDHAVQDNPLFSEAGQTDASGYRLLEGSSAIGSGASFVEPPFPMENIGIFSRITANATTDYFGNPTDLTQSKGNIGAYNGSPILVSSIEEKILESQLYLYPNPVEVHEDFHIALRDEFSFSPSIVTMHDGFGVKVFEKSYGHQKNIKIPTKGLNKGLYFVSIKSNEYTERIVKLIVN